MRWIEGKSGNLDKHWMVTAQRDGQAIPVTVVAKWRWYTKGSGQERRRYALTELVALIGSAAIPVAAAAHVDPTIIAVIGALVLVATGVRTTFGLHENWVEQSRIGFAIEREAALFINSSPPYDGAGAVRELVARVENIADEGGRRWARRRMTVERNREVGEKAHD